MAYDPHGTAQRAHYSRSQRRAMTAMARSLDIDPQRHPMCQLGCEHTDETGCLWSKIAEKIAGGVPRASTVIVGDPFGLFVTFRCYNHRNAPREQVFVTKRRDGQPIDEEEGTRIITQFMDAGLNVCDECGEKLTEYTSTMTRESVWLEQERQSGKAKRPTQIANARNN